MLFAGALGVGLERFAYRPLYLRGATRLGPLISAIGASIFLQNAVMLTQGARMKVYMTSLLFPRSWRIQIAGRSEEHTSELQSQSNLVCRLLLEKKKQKN